MKLLFNLILNLIAVACSIYGAILGNQMAANFIVFWAGFNALMAFFVLLMSKERCLALKGEIKTPEWLSHGLDLCTILPLVFAGWFWCASGMLFSLSMAAYIYGLKPETKSEAVEAAK